MRFIFIILTISKILKTILRGGHDKFDFWKFSFDEAIYTEIKKNVKKRKILNFFDLRFW